MKVDLIESVQLSESVVCCFVDALGNPLVATASVCGFPAIIEMGVESVNHRTREEDPSTACGMVSGLSALYAGVTNPWRSIHKEQQSTTPPKQRQDTTASEDRILPIEILEQTWR